MRKKRKQKYSFMRKITFILFVPIIMLFLGGCGTDEKIEIAEDNTDTKVTSYEIEISWDDEMIGEDYDIEFITDDDGSGYKIEKSAGKALIKTDNSDISFDLTYVWLPPVGTLNNLPRCEAKIYENGKLVENVSTDNTDYIYQAPTGAAGFGICSVDKGKLMDYSGEWQVFRRK